MFQYLQAFEILIMKHCNKLTQNISWQEQLRQL
jgi:hypothetical protein